METIKVEEHALEVAYHEATHYLISLFVSLVEGSALPPLKRKFENY